MGHGLFHCLEMPGYIPSLEFFRSDGKFQVERSNPSPHEGFHYRPTSKFFAEVPSDRANVSSPSALDLYLQVRKIISK
jgi:hypothetical protein